MGRGGAMVRGGLWGGTSEEGRGGASEEGSGL